MDVICRICDDRIPRQDMDLHSQSCAAAHEFGLKWDEAMRELRKHIKDVERGSVSDVLILNALLKIAQKYGHAC
jgi:hypothetical protein